MNGDLHVEADINNKRSCGANTGHKAIESNEQGAVYPAYAGMRIRRDTVYFVQLSD